MDAKTAVRETRGSPYLTVVMDHDSGRLVWAAPGRDTALRRFFDTFRGPSGQRRSPSADAADWIADVVAERCPNAIRCADPFHVVAWATEALDVERRRAWNDARAIARCCPAPWWFLSPRENSRLSARTSPPGDKPSSFPLADTHRPRNVAASQR